MEEHADEIFRKLGKEILERSKLDIVELDFLTRIAGNNSDAFRHVKPATKSTLVKRINDIAEDSLDEESRETLKRLLGLLERDNTNEIKSTLK